jgi:hypothetical protein
LQTFAVRGCDTIKKIKETVNDASKEAGLKVNREKTKYTLLSHHQRAGQNHDIKKANTSNNETLERFQSKTLRMIVYAPWYVPNTLIWRDLQIPSVKEEISHYSSHYSARLTAHSNDILLTLLEPPELEY